MLQVKHINFSYLKQPILKAVNFSVAKGEHLAIIGESGSGKSTLLKLIHGEYDIDSGGIFWNDTPLLGPKYNLVVGKDFMKYVAQEFDLMPFISVAESIGTYLSNFFPEEKQKRITKLLEVVELTKYAQTKVKQLSGGQKQRVAIARALAVQPEIILLDEPFSHIDNFKKQSLRRNIFNFLKTINCTCIVATHDKHDVLGHADSVLVLHQGQVIAKNTPEHLYTYPKLPLIASFFGEFTQFDSRKIVYAHQFKVVEKSNIKVTVTNAYFKGHFYLIEGHYNNKPLFFEHTQRLEIHTTCYLKII